MKERKKVEVSRSSCSNVFKKDESEVKRNLKLKRKNYCNLICAGNSKENLAHLKKINPLDASHLNPYNRKDEYSPFKEYIRRSNRRKQDVFLDAKDLKEIWEKQKGKCTYSKVNLNLTTTGINDPIYTASLDRIDSSIGYVKENVQFISIMMNHMKNNMTHEKMLEALKILRSK